MDFSQPANEPPSQKRDFARRAKAHDQPEIDVALLQAQNERNRINLKIMSKDMSACCNDDSREYFRIKRQKILAEERASARSSAQNNSSPQAGPSCS
ncbi:hypothetical protein PtA15_1A625 [Puccinia triticina]|uniref:No apical meristem-associated C-terminal domain-containing protein n=1 Tax=Puccinia triticina TaxID=208348 RepID=A0ABY7C911_9BASI|nr:uncharacterized protein PtA15_1A625 [Puccinia triticina]WAQ81285.1 hypothetical protein PtA15_1A625 [Puccinia triticina]